MADWYVYQHDGDPLGPWSTDSIADGILAGKLAPDVWVAAPGGPRWLRALAAFGVAPIPGPFDEIVLLLVAAVLWFRYRDRLRAAWREAAAA